MMPGNKRDDCFLLVLTEFYLANLMHGQRTNPGRGMDSEIKDQLTQEDEDKPWKKPGLFDEAFLASFERRNG